MKRLLAAVFFCSFFASTAYASTDEGASNYWKSKQDDRSSIKKYVPRAEADKDSKIGREETISVTLQQAFIADLGSGSDNSVVVIVKCLELNGGNRISFSKGVPGDGRVVFFSPDVRVKQFLNFSQMPIYGPITYKGSPLLFEIYIVRLKDDNREAGRGMLNVIANLGKVVYPPASPFLDYLNQIGTSILNSPNNDIVFHYTMTLYPDDGYKKLKNGVVEAGDYFFIREKKRENKTPWNDLCLDEESGRLYKKNKGQPDCKQAMHDETNLYDDNTYLSIQINKGYNSIGLDVQETYTQFQNRLDDQKGAQTGNQNTLAVDFVNSLMRTEQFAEAKSIISERKRTSNGNMTKLALIMEKLKDSVETEDKRPQEGKTTQDGKPQVFSTDQIDYLLHELSQLTDGNDGVILTRNSLKGNGFENFLKSFLKSVEKAEVAKKPQDSTPQQGQ